MTEDNAVKYPYENEYCHRCIYSYLIELTEMRCCKIKIGMSDCMCARIVECGCYKENNKK